MVWKMSFREIMGNPYANDVESFESNRELLYKLLCDL